MSTQATWSRADTRSPWSTPGGVAMLCRLDLSRYVRTFGKMGPLYAIFSLGRDRADGTPSTRGYS